MVNLNWKGKEERIGVLSKKSKSLTFHILDYYPSNRIDPILEDNWENILIWGENKTAMNLLLKKYENKISLIYIDPPFATGGDFNLKIQIGEKGKFLDRLAYKDKWREGLDSYLQFLYERLVLMKKLLSGEGSIYVHLDWHISHYIKLIMDEIFGIENFRNEIIWSYPAASVKTRRFFIRSYDTILFYSKSDDYIFNDDSKIYMEYSNRVKNALKKDEKGIFYYRGGSHNGKKLSRKVYVEQEGIFPRDVWHDIPYVRANTSEYQGFSTQKPERLLKRIIIASTNENDLIADFFCGSGTTLVVAEKLGRRWIGCDSNRFAVHIARKRILDISKSKDIFDWKSLYNKDYCPFRIELIDKINELKLASDIFFKKSVEINGEVKIKKFPDFNIKIHQRNNEIKIELKYYEIDFLDLMSEKVKEKVNSFSDWIDYWSIDFNSKNDIFTAIWFSYRTPKNRSLQLISNWYKYKKSGNYFVQVKVIDIFGIETIKRFEISIIL
ncbi:MAG: site-specific DNA-methyltransferase [Candidatus Hodarchaeota archaeon]